VTGPIGDASLTGSNQQQVGGPHAPPYQVLQTDNYSLHLGAAGKYMFNPKSNGS